MRQTLNRQAELVRRIGQVDLHELLTPDDDAVVDRSDRLAALLVCAGPPPSGDVTDSSDPPSELEVADASRPYTPDMTAQSPVQAQPLV